MTAEYGEYLAVVCVLCHADNLAGGTVPGEERSDAPFAPNLTPKGALSNWSDLDFVSVLRNGTTLAGKCLDGEFMPWPRFKALTDDELIAIFLYLSSLPPLDTNN